MNIGQGGLRPGDVSGRAGSYPIRHDNSCLTVVQSGSAKTYSA